MIKFIFFIIIVFTLSCKQKNCFDLKTNFSSYNDALKTITNTTFSIEESLDTTKSSWVKEVKYFSCNKKNGFLVFRTSSKSYIYDRVPIGIWMEFKKANSIGKFYNKRLKSNYQLILNN